MSKQRQDYLQSSRFVIIDTGDYKHATQDYDNYGFIHLDELTPKKINDNIGTSTDYFVFLGRHQGLYSPNALSLLDKALSGRMVQIAYSDLQMIDSKGRSLFIQHFPSYDVFTNYMNLAINTPLVMNAKLCTPFDENVKHLFLWDKLIETSHSRPLHHIPLPLFYADIKQSESLQEDLKYINEKYNKRSQQATG